MLETFREEKQNPTGRKSVKLCDKVAFLYINIYVRVERFPISSELRNHSVHCVFELVKAYNFTRKHVVYHSQTSNNGNSRIFTSPNSEKFQMMGKIPSRLHH